ncbi:tetratricopeptide repeat protein [Pirellulimonas nuda]|uniref:Tetratricopeptide repeat protein n=1 Tax=Pirellulimonas nuda TaxID=2528009 RepID=A0A518DD59_9BACT|nr:alkaline phosphatase family protein [Pirellulimonas nuda]QDU89417.1 tetratricopeptide repeat protein [Pirellulimonas nuda]
MRFERNRGSDAPDRVLLVGWDAADWQMIQPLVERGLMPTLASLMREGAWGNLASIQPMLSPMLWNSIATGKRASKHGVYGFTEPDPDHGGVRPSSSTTRKCKALWNIATQCGLKSNVVGWYASHPAEPIDGVMVSNQFEVFRPQGDGVSPPAPQSVHPPELLESLAELRVRPAEIDAAAILPFIPDAARLVGQDAHRVGKLQQLLAQTATVHAAATRLMTDTDWDFSAVYYEGIDRFGHEFMEFHPPKMDAVSQADFEAYRHCMAGVYRFHDMMLQTLLTLAGDRTAVVLMSDHGYYSNHLRPDPRPGKAGPVEWHRPFGVLAAKGPGVRPGSRLFGASILDVAPTVLRLLGLPAGYDMPGRELAEALVCPPGPERVNSWEQIDGPCGMHPADLRVDPVEAREAMQQLVALGYIDAPSEDTEASVRDTIAQNQLVLAQSMVDAGEFQEALAVIDAIDPTLRETTPGQLLRASCLLALGDRAAARQTLAPLADSGEDAPRMHMMLGTLELADGDTEQALAHFQQVAAASPRLPGLHTKLGGVYLTVGRYDQAIEAYERALEIDPESPPALEGLARARLETGRPQEALDLALCAAEFVHQFPRAHLTIGRAMIALGDYPGAAEALELCVRQAPKLADAHRALAAVYRELGDSARAVESELRASRVLA